MDLILPLLSGLGILGYSLNKNGKKPRKEEQVRTVMSANDTPNENNIYSSVRTKEILNDERAMANAKYIQSQDPATTNIIPPFYNSMHDDNFAGALVSNETNTILPSATSQPSIQGTIDKVMNSPMFQSSSFLNNSGAYETTEPFGTVVKEAFTVPKLQNNGQMVSELSGCAFDGSHNNMVPFFGANATQNVDPNKSQALLDRYTGNDRDIQRHKSETKIGFPSTGVRENIHGTPISQDRSRFHQSNLKTKLLPLPQIREAPLPADAFRGQYKNVDQLRVKPRITNKTAATVEGLRFGVASQPVAYTRNKPEESYNSGIQHTFVASRNNKPGMRRNYTNGRESTTEHPTQQGIAYKGNGFANAGPRQILISDALNDIDNVLDGDTLTTMATDDNRNTDHSSGFRNSGRRGNDKFTSRIGYRNPAETERDTTSTSRFNPVNATRSGKRYRNNQRSRTTNKENILYSYTGNAIKDIKKRTGFRGRDTRNANKLYIKNYKSNGGDKRGFRVNEAYERGVIKSNRENISNRKNYDLEYKKGSIIGNGVDNIGDTSNKDDTLRKSRRVGNINNVFQDTPNTRNYGITEVNGNRALTEHDQSDRIGSVFTKQLMSNSYSHDIKKGSNKKRKIKRRRL